MADDPTQLGNSTNNSTNNPTNNPTKPVADSFASSFVSKRMVAKKVRICDITNGKYASGSRESREPSYVITPLGEKVSRLNVIATVTDKFASEDGNYSSITIDDGTDAIRAKAFGEDAEIFEPLKKGELVVVVGKVKEYQNEIYVNAEIARAVEPNYEALRRLELLEQISERKKIVDNLRKIKSRMEETAETEADKAAANSQLKEYAKKMGIEEEALEVILESREPDYKPALLDIISSLDEGSGVEILKIFEISKLPESVIERAIDELLREGEIFEPSPGKFRVIKV